MPKEIPFNFKLKFSIYNIWSYLVYVWSSITSTFIVKEAELDTCSNLQNIKDCITFVHLNIYKIIKIIKYFSQFVNHCYNYVSLLFAKNKISQCMIEEFTN